MIKFGTVFEVRPGYARVNLADDHIPTAFLPVLVRKGRTDKESWQLELDEQVVCLMEHRVGEDGKIYEDCDTGVILGVIPSEQDAPDAGEAAGKFRKLFSDGTLVEYNKSTHTLTVDVQGNLSGKATGNVTIEAPSITLDGDVTVNGTITATGEIKSGEIKLTKHTHTTPSGQSGLPLP